MKYRSCLATVVLLTATGLCACGDEFDWDTTGACVSDPVHLQFSSKVYCYDGWDYSDCAENDAEQVNGAGWSFHEGQDCSDLDLTTGSNNE